MAKIKKHPNAIWYSDFWWNGKRVRVPLSPYKDKALELLKDMLDLRKSEKTGITPRSASWIFFREKYLKNSKLLKKPSTYDNDNRAFRMVEKYGRPILRLDQMTPEYLGDFWLKCREKGIKERTISGCVRVIKTAMHKAEEWGMSTPQLWKKVKCLPDGKRNDYLSYEEFLNVVAASEGPFIRGSMLLGWSGLRNGEVVHLGWPDVDFKRHGFHVRAKEDWAPKGSKPNAPKERFVPMSKKLEIYLLSLPDRKGKGFVLGEKITEDYFSKYYKKLGRKMGIRLYPHKFRHTCASFLISTGSTLEEVGKILGQEDPRSTKIYAHMMDSAQRKAVDRMQTGLDEQYELDKMRPNGDGLVQPGL